MLGVEGIELFLSLQMFFSMVRPSVCADCHPSHLGSQRLGGRCATFFDVYFSKTWFSVP